LDCELILNQHITRGWKTMSKSLCNKLGKRFVNILTKTLKKTHSNVELKRRN